MVRLSQIKLVRMTFSILMCISGSIAGAIQIQKNKDE